MAVLDPDLTERDSSLDSLEGNGSEEAASETGPMHSIIALARRKAWIAKVTASGILIGTLLALILPPRYTATTRIMTPQQSQSAASLLMNQLGASQAVSLASSAGASLGLRTPNDIYVGLLQSRPVMDTIIQHFGLLNVYSSKDMTAAREKLGKNTQIISEKSGMIAISVTDKRRDRAAAMANAYTEELRHLTQSLAFTEASRRRMFYEGQLKESKEALVKAEFAFQKVQQEKGLVAPGAQATAMIERLAMLHSQITAKQVALQSLRSYSTEENPELQIGETELSALQAEARRLQESSSNRPEFANLHLEDVPTAGLEFLSAEHEFLYQRTLYDLLIKQYDAARLDESKDATVIQIVEPATPPDRKSSPHRAIIVVWFAMLGCFSACGYVLAMNHVEHDPDLARSLGELRSALRFRAKAR